jgi:hypothetical protein
MGAMKAESGIPSTLSGTSATSLIKRFRRFANIAAKSILLRLRRLSRESIAATTARPVLCVGVEEWGRADVYCLTVPTTAAFTIEGGFVVHNCADEVRYACMSRPWIRVVEPKESRDSWDDAFDDDEEESWKTA